MAITSASAGRQARPTTRQLRIEYASLEARVAAAALDVLIAFIVAALLILAGSIIILISSDFERVDPSETSINIFWACAGAIVPAWIFYLFIALCWKGQTIGQSVMQIMVIRSDSRPLGLFGSVARVIGLMVYAVFIGAGAITAYAFKDSAVASGAAVGIACFFVAAGLLWGAFDKHRRTLHDRIAGTIVVKVA